MQKVLILLSTYNGEKYLEEQLLSIFNQRGVEASLLVRDDGSSDNTISILKNFSEEHPSFVLNIIEGANIGSATSFCELMREAYTKYSNRSDFFAFADQDDYWLEDKLLSATEVLKSTTETKPSLYLGAYQMVDYKLTPIPTSLRKPKLNLPSAMASNSATGCTMVFNKQLLSILAKEHPDDIIMHDYWAYIVCLAVGGNVFYDVVPHILYRQHGNNVIGGIQDSFVKRWSVRFNKLFRPGDRFKSKLAAQLLHCYSDMIGADENEFLRYVTTCRKWLSKIKLLKNKEFRGESIDANLQIIGLIITGKL